jgi:hypothetical protein
MFLYVHDCAQVTVPKLNVTVQLHVQEICDSNVGLDTDFSLVSI